MSERSGRAGSARGASSARRALLVVFVAGATVAGREAGLRAGSREERALREKQRIEARETEERRNAVALGRGKPADPQRARPHPGPPPERLTGILEGIGGAGILHGLEVTNAWQGLAGGGWVQAYAGARQGSPGKGVLLVIREVPWKPSSEEELLETPEGSGALRILSEEGTSLRLAAGSGACFRIDLSSRGGLEIEPGGGPTAVPPPDFGQVPRSTAETGGASSRPGGSVHRGGEGEVAQ